MKFKSIILFLQLITLWMCAAIPAHASKRTPEVTFVRAFNGIGSRDPLRIINRQKLFGKLTYSYYVSNNQICLVLRSFDSSTVSKPYSQTVVLSQNSGKDPLIPTSIFGVQISPTRNLFSFKLGYESSTFTSYTIFLVNPQSGKVRPITGLLSHRRVEWSPDGNFIAYVQEDTKKLARLPKSVFAKSHLV